jgi:hypothetical protein
MWATKFYTQTKQQAMSIKCSWGKFWLYLQRNYRNAFRNFQYVDSTSPNRYTGLIPKLVYIWRAQHWHDSEERFEMCNRYGLQNGQKQHDDKLVSVKAKKDLASFFMDMPFILRFIKY